MAGDQLMGRVHITAFSKRPCQHIFLIRFQHGKGADLFHITGQAALWGQGRDYSIASHLSSSYNSSLFSYMGIIYHFKFLTSLFLRV